MLTESPECSALPLGAAFFHPLVVAGHDKEKNRYRQHISKLKISLIALNLKAEIDIL
jgi:hypothetical protein